MELRILGCHGGETARHRSTSFLLDDRVGLDAGATTSMLTLEEQLGLDAVIVSHAHLDHVRDLAALADNRAQGARAPLVVAGTAFTVRALNVGLSRATHGRWLYVGDDNSEALYGGERVVRQRRV